MMKRKQSLFPLRYGRGTQKVTLYPPTTALPLLQVGLPDGRQTPLSPEVCRGCTGHYGLSLWPTWEEPLTLQGNGSRQETHQGTGSGIKEVVIPSDQ